MNNIATGADLIYLINPVIGDLIKASLIRGIAIHNGQPVCFFSSLWGDELKVILWAILYDLVDEIDTIKNMHT